VSGDEGPMLRRRRLGVELKRCREAAGLTQEQVSQHFEWHAAKMTRVETAKVAVTSRDVKDLLTLYDVHDGEYRDGLVELARSSRGRPWWAEYRDIVQPDSYIALEAEASALRNWEPTVIPGLLQTEAYMRALFATVAAAGRRIGIDRAVSLRRARQRRLTGDPTLALYAIIDESTIRRQIGGQAVMTAQLRHLTTLSELPNVQVQILPYSAGEHPLLGTSLAILEFHDAADLDIVYLEGTGRPAHHIRQPAEVVRHREQFERLSMRCLDHPQSMKMIEDVITG